MAAGLPKDALRNQHRSTFKAGEAIVSGGTAGGGFLQGIASKIGVGEQAEPALGAE